jgi:hypothetical protein
VLAWSEFLSVSRGEPKTENRKLKTENREPQRLQRRENRKTVNRGAESAAHDAGNANRQTAG